MKILAMILTILLTITYAQTSAIWNGSVDTDWYTNNTSATEYTITTPQQLAGLAELVNGGNNFKGKTVKLGANIMLNDTTGWENWASKPPTNNWTPIGIKDSMCMFNGIFDGNKYIVSGAYINTTSNGQGLFRKVYTNGTIKNLGVVASYIKGNLSIGGLVGGYNQGTISNSHFTGMVTGDSVVGGLAGGNSGTINNSYSAGTVVAKDLHAGGLVGENEGKINNSYSTGIVEGTNAIGGLVGYNNGEITESYSTGVVTAKDWGAGGLVGLGKNDGKISKSYSTGAVMAKDFYAGGLVGVNDRGEINNSYSTGTVTAKDWGAGGLVGGNNGKISKSYSTGTVTVTSGIVGGLAGTNGGEINNSYSTGTVKGGKSVGGFVGQNYYYIGENDDDISIGTISDSYSIGKVVGGIYLPNGYVEIYAVNGLVGDYNGFAGTYAGDYGGGKISNSYYDSQASGMRINMITKSRGEGKTTAQMKQKATFKDWNFNKTWGINNKINDGYPYLLENKGQP